MQIDSNYLKVLAQSVNVTSQQNEFEEATLVLARSVKLTQILVLQERDSRSSKTRKRTTKRGKILFSWWHENNDYNEGRHVVGICWFGCFDWLLVIKFSSICENSSAPRKLLTQQNKIEETQISPTDQKKRQKSAFLFLGEKTFAVVLTQKYPHKCQRVFFAECSFSIKFWSWQFAEGGGKDKSWKSRWKIVSFFSVFLSVLGCFLFLISLERGFKIC